MSLAEEQEAGRRAVERNCRDEIVDTGWAELSRRFPGCILKAQAWEETPKQFIVKVAVRTSAGVMMVFDDTVRGFPNDALIAQIALVA